MHPAPSFDIATEAPIQVEPTTRGRVAVYDFIRGVAIFGILLANISWFATPAFSEMASMTAPSGNIDGLVDQWTTALVAGKYRSMLAILFGIGIWLQFKKRSQVAGNWPGGYLKRAALLGGFGIVHGVFIWFGDILFMYACVAFLACLFVGFSERVHRNIIGAVFALAVVGAAVLMLLAQVSGGDLGMNSGDMGLGITEATERAAFSTGSYWEQLAMRAQIFAMMAGSVVFFLPFLGGLFLLGILLGRHEVLAQPSRHVRTRNAMLAIGFGIGLPLNLMTMLLARENAFFIESATEILFGPLLSLGLIMLLAVIAEMGWFASIQRALAKVGRTAFSNYILQSLLCTTLFYSWGFGLYGKLNRFELLYVVAGVWAANILFAHFWLMKFQLGPLEWLWRSLTEGRRLPIRKEPAA